MHSRWNRSGWQGLLVVIAIAGVGCRERSVEDRYPTNLGTQEQPLLPTGCGTYGGPMPESSAKIVTYEPGAPDEAAERGAAEAPVDQPASLEAKDAGATEPPVTDVAGTAPSAADEAAIRALCQSVADGGPGQLDRFVVPEQQARVTAIIGPMQDLAGALGDISDRFADSAPQAAALARATREQIVGAFAGSAEPVTDIRMVEPDQASARWGGRDISFERSGERWLVRIADLPEEGNITAFTNALRDLVDAFDAVVIGLEEGELTDAAAVEQMTAAAQQFAAQRMGANP